MPSNQSNQSSGAKASSSSSASGSGQSEKPVTKYRIVKDGWGDRKNFQHSYGLGSTSVRPCLLRCVLDSLRRCIRLTVLTVDPDSMEEGNAILEAMLEQDRRERK